MSAFADTSILWTPSVDRIAGSNMTAFMQFLQTQKGLSFEDDAALYKWSVTAIDDFWQTVWQFADIIHSQDFSRIRAGDDIQTAQWFLGARLNFAENLLRYNDDKEAIVYWSESGERTRITYRELRTSVQTVAQYLRNQGVGKGDRVAAYISNRPEAIVSMLATVSIGAIWSSCSPDFGYAGVLDRFGQIAPKVLIAVEHYQYNGKKIDCTATIEQLTQCIGSIQKTILVNVKNESPDPRFITWEETLQTVSDSLVFEQLPFDHPLYIMYSSGTTGKPKCIVHGAGGTLLQHYKELALHTDLGAGDVLTYYTTCGWMMWNWMVSSLMLGVKVLIYDGSPAYPSLDILYRAIEEEGVNVFGTSPKFLSTCQSKFLKPIQKFNLSSMRTVLSTGSPLLDAHFEYVYAQIKSDVQVASISGGTDIISCFILGNPNLPVRRGELQCRGLGMKVAVFDENGNPVIDQIGELVCTAPIPSRPIYFWDDPKGEKYYKAYFGRFDKIWTHGDFVKINSHGGCVVYGRSDATLNAGGIRIGTAEIYGTVEALEEVLDSIVVEVNTGDEAKVVLFVVLAEGLTLSDEIKSKINTKLRADRSPRHVPSAIHQVAEIPRTLSGKKVELAVKRMLEGKVVDNRDALANPVCLDAFGGFSF